MCGIKFDRRETRPMHEGAVKQKHSKQGVALTRRNTTGPPSHAAPWWVTLHMRALQTTDDESRQRP